MHFEMKKDVLLGRCTLEIGTYIKMHWYYKIIIFIFTNPEIVISLGIPNFSDKDTTNQWEYSQPRFAVDTPPSAAALVIPQLCLVQFSSIQLDIYIYMYIYKYTYMFLYIYISSSANQT